jgi:hypothetical protein
VKLYVETIPFLIAQCIAISALGTKTLSVTCIAGNARMYTWSGQNVENKTLNVLPSGYSIHFSKDLQYGSFRMISHEGISMLYTQILPINI